MVKAGIIDPAKVTRSALQNAASVAALLLTTECAITDLPEKNPMPPPAAAWVEWAEWAGWTTNSVEFMQHQEAPREGRFFFAVAHDTHVG